MCLHGGCLEHGGCACTRCLPARSPLLIVQVVRKGGRGVCNGAEVKAALSEIASQAGGTFMQVAFEVCERKLVCILWALCVLCCACAVCVLCACAVRVRERYRESASVYGCMFVCLLSFV